MLWEQNVHAHGMLNPLRSWQRSSNNIIFMLNLEEIYSTNLPCNNNEDNYCKDC